MSFSQAWDTGFKAVLIFVGIVFSWLGFVEHRFESQQQSVLLMTVVALAAAAAFFAGSWRRYSVEKKSADAEIRALETEDFT